MSKESAANETNVRVDCLVMPSDVVEALVDNSRDLLGAWSWKEGTTARNKSDLEQIRTDIETACDILAASEGRFKFRDAREMAKAIIWLYGEHFACQLLRELDMDL